MAAYVISVWNLLLACLIFVSAFLCLKNYRQLSQITEILVDGERVYLYVKGDLKHVYVDSIPWLAQFLTIVSFRFTLKKTFLGKCSVLVLLPDSAEKEDLRELRVFLKSGGWEKP